MKNISKLANRLLFNFHCIGVNNILKTILSRKGNTTIKPISPFNNLLNTEPKEINIKIYSKDHTGPNNQEGGAHEGLLVFR